MRLTAEFESYDSVEDVLAALKDGGYSFELEFGDAGSTMVDVESFRVPTGADTAVRFRFFHDRLLGVYYYFNEAAAAAALHTHLTAQAGTEAPVNVDTLERFDYETFDDIYLVWVSDLRLEQEEQDEYKSSSGY